MENEFGIRAQQLGEHLWLVSLHGEHDMASHGDLRRTIFEVFAAGSTLIVDLTDATFIDSAIISALVDAHEHAISRAADDLLVVAPPGTRPRRVIDLTGIGGAIKVHDDRSSALAAVELPQSPDVRRERRLAHNEVLFRRANDLIHEHAQTHGVQTEPVAFFCECADRDCTERIEVPIVEYERAHASPTRFLLRPGHERTRLEHITDRSAEYVVVEKDGLSGAVAASELG